MPMVDDLAHVRAGAEVWTRLFASWEKFDMEVCYMDENELDMALEPALDSIDRATLALHLSRMARARVDRVEHARVACATFDAAIQELCTLSQEIQRTDAWRHWAEEARHCRTLAREELQRLGA